MQILTIQFTYFSTPWQFTITCSRRNTCGYAYKYDNSRTFGDLATDTLTFNSASFPISFGCSHYTNGRYARSISGRVGLGRGPLSLVSQLGPSIGGKLSYCLIPFAKEGKFTSTISFGNNTEVSGPGAITTPIVQGVPGNYYFLTLKGISVGYTRIPFYNTTSSKADSGTSTSTSNRGNIYIDSATMLTTLPVDIFAEFTTALINSIKSQVINDPSAFYKICYDTKYEGSDLKIPDVIFHFEGGDLVLKPSNTFLQVGDNVCLVMLPVDGQTAILGNYALTDFLVGYDIEQGKVSFKPTDCTQA